MVFVNGRKVETDKEIDLQELLELVIEQGIVLRGVVNENSTLLVNNRSLEKNNYRKHVVADGDRITILPSLSGG